MPRKAAGSAGRGKPGYSAGMFLTTFCALLLLFLCAASSLTAGDSPKKVRAARITQAPRIDGILDEPVWKTAEPAADFTQRDPEEGKPASERSEIRVLYDDEAIYFGCMFYDREPGKIVSRLTRRDDEIESDWGSLRIDSYHDHLTAYEFTFNPAGVKVDILEYDDANYDDDSWDPVWELETRITAEGWCAEIRIPFASLRYRQPDDPRAEQEWGINFIRYISRKQESDRWVHTPKSETGFVSRFGHLTGLVALPHAKQLELLPFGLARLESLPPSDNRDRVRDVSANGGLDLKYAISSNFTLDATFNPDFGQVEADPAVLNLSTFETFYPEKRPFFIEGTQIVHFTTFGSSAGPGMFYSRRIGRAISEGEAQVPAGGRIESIPQRVTILGAAKVSGKTAGGLAVGLLEAVTKEARATVVDAAGNSSNEILEPLANYNILRIKQDILSNSTVGAILTSTAKDGRDPAVTSGLDWNLVLDRNSYLVDGFLALSHARSFFDGTTGYGSAGKAEFQKIAGTHWLWGGSADWTAKKYNIDDVGFFFRPNDRGVLGNLTYKEDVPAELLRSWSVTLNLHARENFDRANLFRMITLSGSSLFTNYWSVSAQGSVDYGRYDDRETRGMGLYAKPATSALSLSAASDARDLYRVIFSGSLGWDAKKKKSAGISLELDMKPATWMSWTVQSGYSRVLNFEAWFANISPAADEQPAPVFGDRSTTEFNLVVRSTVTFTRDLTLQLYAQQFLAKGHYENYRRLLDPETFGQFGGLIGANPDFNLHNLNINFVLRWEYLPGSTAYLVWSHARSGGNANYFSSFQHDFTDTYGLPPANVILLKVSYWMRL